MKDKIKNQILENIEIHQKILNTCINDIKLAADLMISSVRKKKKILWCGNGGSAADAQHLSTELMGGMSSHNRKAISSIALTTDTSFLTAWSNDTDFDSIFSRQIQGLGKKDDVLIAISTSGNSENIISAIKQAKYKGLNTIVFTGISDGKVNGMGDVTIKIPSDNTQRIQEAHIMIGQILCSLLEDDFNDING